MAATLSNRLANAVALERARLTAMQARTSSQPANTARAYRKPQRDWHVSRRPGNPRGQLGSLTIALGVLREARLRRRPPGYGAEGLPLAAGGHTEAPRTPASATASKAEAGPGQAEAGLWSCCRCGN
jgi:hypothetical protein